MVEHVYFDQQNRAAVIRRSKQRMPLLHLSVDSVGLIVLGTSSENSELFVRAVVDGEVEKTVFLSMEDKSRNSRIFTASCHKDAMV